MTERPTTTSQSPPEPDTSLFDTAMLPYMGGVLVKAFRKGDRGKAPLPLSPTQWLLLTAVVWGPVAGLILSEVIRWPQGMWREATGHVLVALFGALTALCTAYVGLRVYMDSGSRRLLFLVLALVTMAAFDTGSAGINDGSAASLWMRALRSLIGGAWFLTAGRLRGGVRFPLVPRERRRVVWALGFYVFLILLTGVLFVRYKGLFPVVRAGGTASIAITCIHVLGALLLLMAAFSFLNDYRRGGGAALFVLALALVLLCDNAVMSGLAPYMDVTCWLRHLVKLAAYLLFLVGLTVGFANMSVQYSRLAAERKRAEELARREQATLRGILDSIADQVFAVDTELVIQNVNAEMVRQQGDAALPDSGLIGHRCHEIFHREDKACAGCCALEVLRTGRPVSGHVHTHRTKSGGQYTAEVSAAPIRDAAGLAIGAVMVVRDITDRERVAKALRREQDFINRIIQAADVLVVSMDLQGKITLFNRKCEELTGYAASEVIGRPLWERLLPERFVEPVKQVFFRLKEDILPSEFENPWLTRSGEERWIVWHNTNIKDAAGKVTDLIGIGVDVTEKIKAEESARFLSGLIEQSAQGLRVTTCEGQVVRFNRAFQEMTGYTEKELRRMTVRDLAPPRWQEVEERRREEALKTGRPLTYEMEVLRKDGRTVPVEMVTDVFCDAKGIPEYLYSFVRDITHRKRAEEERQRLLDQLQQVRKMGAIETLAGGIAHEFNNVLGVILGYASLLKMKVDRAGPLFKAMDAIEKAAQRGSEFTHQMFSFARIGKYDTKATDLNEVVKRIIGLLAESLPPAHQTQAYYQEGIWPVEGDAGALGQALLNVCMNAREAMPEGGRLVVETENVTVSEEQARTHVEARPGPYVVVSVTDSGVGMRPDMIHRIFDPFFTTKNGKSAGMGLTIVYGVVKSHGGYITVESEVGKGSCFRIHLPAKPPAPAAAEGPVAAPMRGTETLLLAEDEELVRSAAADMLRELGYHVLTASNGKEAASLYRRNKDKVALVLMDVVMPGMTGQEACQALRRINPAVKILLSSGYGIGEDEVSSFGAQGLIHKPFRIDELATAVRALVGKAAPQR